MTRFRNDLSFSPLKKPQDLHLNNLRHSLSEKINPFPFPSHQIFYPPALTNGLTSDL